MFPERYESNLYEYILLTRNRVFKRLSIYSYYLQFILYTSAILRVIGPSVEHPVFYTTVTTGHSNGMSPSVEAPDTTRNVRDSSATNQHSAIVLLHSVFMCSLYLYWYIRPVF
jgi:hypothetical protein